MHPVPKPQQLPPGVAAIFDDGPEIRGYVVASLRAAGLLNQPVTAHTALPPPPSTPVRRRGAGPQPPHHKE